MKKSIAKKTIILYVLYMFEKGICKHAPATATEISNVLNSLGVKCDRKTVGRNIRYLQDFGYPIVKGKRGYYMNGALNAQNIWRKPEEEDVKDLM